MKKFFIALIFFIANIIAKDPWVCGDRGVYRCGMKQTCCLKQDRTFMCHNMINAVCCTFRDQPCPNGTVCDDKVEGGCRTVSLEFMP
jgi:hypothetical protein